MVENIREFHSIAFKRKIFIRKIELIYMYTRVTPLQDNNSQKFYLESFFLVRSQKFLATKVFICTVHVHAHAHVLYVVHV